MAPLPNSTTLSEQLNFTVLRIVASSPPSKEVQIGTGYVCVVKLNEDAQTLVVVTNRHVVIDASVISFDAHLAMENGEPDSETLILDIILEQTVVSKHPNCDLIAIMITPALKAKLAKGYKFFIKPIPFEYFSTDKTAVDLDIVEPVTMVGYPSGLWDKQNKLPLFRRGFTASHPAIDFDGKPEFSVDIAVFSGSSGSPVFLLEQGFLLNKGDIAWAPKQRFWFLGTLWGGPRMTKKGEIRVEPVPTSANIQIETGVRMHLGWVIKAKETQWLLEEMKNYVIDNGLIRTSEDVATIEDH